MLKSIIRMTAVVTVIITAMLSYTQLSFLEKDYPLGTQYSGTILFSDSSLSRAEILDGMRHISREQGIEIYLGTPGKSDPFHGLDLYSLGDSQPDQPIDISWLSLYRHGKLYPASELGDTNLSAVYAVKGSDAGVAALTRWAIDQEATTVGWGLGGPLALFASGLVYGGAGIPLVALVVLGITVVLAWYAARAESRAVRLLAGTSAFRIQAQDMVGWLRIAVPVAALGMLAVGAGFALTRGIGNGLAMAGVVGGYLVALGGVVVVFGVVASVLTRPSVASLALRTPPEARFEFPSQLLKAVTLALGLAALPALLLHIGSSLHQADIQGRVTPLTGYVSQAVGGATVEKLDSSIDDLDRFIAAADATGTVAYAEIVNRDDPAPEFAAEGFDSLAVINARYAQLFGLSQDNGTLAPVAEETAERLVTALENTEAGDLRSGVRQKEKTLTANGLKAYRVVGDGGIVAPTGSGLGFLQARQPLLLVSEHISAALDDDALYAGLSSGYLMFGDVSVIDKAARETAVTSLLMDRSRVTDSALLSAQFAYQGAGSTGASIAVLLAAIAVSGWLSAQVYAANNARFIYPMLTYGRSWWSVLRHRIVAEVGIVTVTFALVSTVYLALAVAWSPVLLLGVACYLVYSAFCHQRAALAMIQRVTHRAH